jgi:predicted  nucleic acid-binding Zn ribbon protein
MHAPAARGSKAMYTAQIDFPFESDPDGEVLDQAYGVLGGWWNDGQVLSTDWPMVEVDGAYRFFVSLPAEDALEPQHSGLWTMGDLDALRETGAGDPIATLLGKDTGALEACECTQRLSLVLFTTFISLESPLRCGDCFGPVPLYCISPVHGESRQSVIMWQEDYKACDTLQMHCETGERFGEREMRELDSSLSKRGREICAAIEEATGLPSYYFLWKGRGRSREAELARVCPSCSEPWLLDEPLHELFDFRCEPCRLLGSIPSGFGEDDGHAESEG